MNVEAFYAKRTLECAVSKNRLFVRDAKYLPFCKKKKKGTKEDVDAKYIFPIENPKTRTYVE